MTEHFKDSELACKCCGTLKLADGFRERLNSIREACNFPFHVNSCCRCPKHNKAEGGAITSFHLTEYYADPARGTCAIDISTASMTDEQYGTLVKIATSSGWSIGENFKKKFIHMDRRVDFGYKQVRFTYP